LSAKLERLRKRADFLAAAAEGRKFAAPGLVLQARQRPADMAPGGPRVGFTASRRVGGAVQRNRAKRRMRVLARDILASAAAADTDYVLIARRAIIARPFDKLLADMRLALQKVGAGGNDRPKRS